MTTKPSIKDVPIAPPRTSLGAQLSWGILLMVLAWSWQGADMRPMALIADSANMAVFSKEFFPPNFHDWRIYLSEMVISIHIAIWGTVLAVICAVPLGLLCAENIAPAWVYQPVRRLMDAFRAINEMVFAMLFIVAVGLGPFAGVMALWIHTMAFWANCLQRPLKPLTQDLWKGLEPQAPTFLKRSFMASFLRYYHFGFHIHSIDLNQMFVLRR
jgi:phosphonate transport system permease protein